MCERSASSSYQEKCCDSKVYGLWEISLQMKCWSLEAPSILHMCVVSLLSLASKRWYSLCKQWSCAGEINDRIIQYSYTHTHTLTPEIEDFIRKAEHWLGFCCYQFLPVRGAVILQTLKFSLRLAGDRYIPLWGAFHSHICPHGGVCGHLESVKISNSHSLPQMGEVINTLCGYNVLNELVRGTTGYCRQIVSITLQIDFEASSNEGFIQFWANFEYVNMLYPMIGWCLVSQNSYLCFHFTSVLISVSALFLS